MMTDIFPRNPLEQRSPLLAGCNNEARALSLGIAALQGGTTNPQFIADTLRPEGAEQLLVFGPKKIGHLINGAHPKLLQSSYVDGEEFTLSDTGVLAAGLGGMLIDFVRTNGSSLHLLMGKARTFEDRLDAVSAPSSRLAIYDAVLARGQRTDQLIEALALLGIGEESVRKHLGHLVGRGWFTKEEAGKTRIVKVNPSKRELLQSFSDTVHSYLDSPDVEAGLAHIEKALKDIKVLPFLIKHATTSQGDRTRQPTQDLQNAVVSFLEGLPPGSNVTTAQIAEAVNRTVAYVNVMLTAAVVGAGPKSPIQKVPTEPKKRARWTLTPPLSFNN